MKRPGHLYSATFNLQAESVFDGGTDWLIPEPTIDAMEAGLRRAIRDKDRWEVMGDAGKRRFESVYSGEVLADRFLAIIAG